MAFQLKPGDNNYSQTDLKMNVNKQDIIENICYTELVDDRINKKLGINYSKEQIEEFIHRILNINSP